jgi:phage tail sheath protein FI
MQVVSIPGVSLEEIPPPAPFVFATGVPAFLGYGAPTGGAAYAAPIALSRWAQFARFVDAPERFLAAAVEGFFQCGGQQCVVILLGPSGPSRLSWDDAVDSLASLDSVDLLCAPSLTSGIVDSNLVNRVQQRLLQACELRGDCFAVLDALSGNDTAAVLAQCASLQGAGAPSRNGALYYPWIVPAGATEAVAPCGHVAGIFSRTDRAGRTGRAPANQPLDGVATLSLAIDDAAQARMGNLAVNCLRAFPGRGPLVWGARTLSTDPNWRAIGVRRLFTTVARWLEQSTTWALMEPNDLRLWVRMTRQLNDYFRQLFQSGSLAGGSAAQAFYVKCDDETNPQAVRDSGNLVVEIGLAPATPGEFIVVRLIQEAGAAHVTVAA